MRGAASGHAASSAALTATVACSATNSAIVTATGSAMFILHHVWWRDLHNWAVEVGKHKHATALAAVAAGIVANTHLVHGEVAGRSVLPAVCGLMIGIGGHAVCHVTAHV